MPYVVVVIARRQNLADRVQADPHSLRVQALVLARHCEDLFRLHGGQVRRRRPRRRRLPAFAGLLVPSARLQVRADSLSRALGKLGKLSRAGVDYCLDFLFGLLRDGNHSVEILVDEQTHEHLEFEGSG